MSAIRSLLVVVVVSGFVLLVGAPATADVYYVQPISELKIDQGERPGGEDRATVDYRLRWRGLALQPYAVLDGEGDIFVTPMAMGSPLTRRWGFGRGELTGTASVAIRVPQARDITGTIYQPKSDYSGMVALKFSLAADQGQEELRESFLQAKLQHYRALLSRNAPGTAWFRHQARVTRKDLGLKAETDENRVNTFRFRGSSLEETYALASGGRAVSENLQLDRLLPVAAVDQPTVELESIKGITNQAFVF
jgi:hypothetical protein